MERSCGKCRNLLLRCCGRLRGEVHENKLVESLGRLQCLGTARFDGCTSARFALATADHVTIETGPVLSMQSPSPCCLCLFCTPLDGHTVTLASKFLLYLG